MRIPWFVAASLGALILPMLPGCGNKPDAPPAPVAETVPATPAPPAAAPAPAPAVTPVLKSQKLTAETIDNTLAVLSDPQLKALREKWKAAGHNDPTAIQASLAAMEANADLQALVAKHHFADFQEWAGTVQKVYVAASMSAMAKAEAEMKAKPAPPAAAASMAQSQEQMKKSMEASKAAVGGVSDDELKAVTTAMPKIEKAGK
jgi:hypothetical protein